MPGTKSAWDRETETAFCGEVASMTSPGTARYQSRRMHNLFQGFFSAFLADKREYVTIALYRCCQGNQVAFDNNTSRFVS